jgi:uncharacterized membrane protein (DUF2068 family)
MAVVWWEHAEGLVCGVRGHVVPARARLPSEWAALSTMTVEGQRLGRCIRCDVWVAVGPPTGEIGELTEAEVPRRGRPLREAIVLRAIAVERGIHSVLFGLATIGLVVLRLDLAGLQSDARRLVSNTTNTLSGPAQNASRDSIQRALERLLNLHRHTLGVLALTAAAYCVVEGIEAVGLWWERRWAEYLTAVATAGLLPFEIDELAHRVTAFRIGALIVNLAVLVYLVWRKHLFGIGGRRPQEDRVGALREALGTIGGSSKS